MDYQSKDHYLVWISQRKSTLVCFAIQSLLLGMEYSLTFLTLWSYITELVKPDNPQVMYGLVSSSYLVSSIVCSLFFGSFIDKHRCIKVTFLLVNILVVIGNIIYVVSYSVAFLIVGRLISGCGGLLRSVMIGEISRVYSSRELTPKYSLMGMMYALGFIIAPSINFAFSSIEIKIYKITINYTNFPSLFMAFFFLAYQFLACFFVHDLSKSYDIKQEMECGANLTLLCDKEPSFERQSTFGVFKKMLTSCDIVLLIYSTFFCTYVITSIEIWLPLIVLETLHWSMTELNAIIFGTGVTCVAVCLLLTKYNLSSKTNFIISQVCLFGFILLILSLMAITQLTYYKAVTITLWILFCIFFASQVVIEDVFLVNSFASMVSTNYQTLADSVRLAASRIGALCALLFSALLYQYILYIGLVFINIIFLGMILFIVRNKFFVNPRIIVK